MLKSVEIPKEVATFLEGNKHMYINGEWVPSESNELYESLNPATNEVITKIYAGNELDVDKAVKAARAAFVSWKKTSPNERAAKLFKLAELIERDAETIAWIESLDYGAPVAFCREAYAKGAMNHIRYFAGFATKIYGKTLELTGTTQAHAYTKREPVGVCGQITSWNFPFLGASWKLAAPIATGNTIVLKPSQQTSLSTLYLAKLVEEAGFPPGVINIVTGSGGKLGEAITSHPDIDKIAFTGSTGVGKGIMRKGADTLKKLTLELGGKSPNIIFDDANLEKAVQYAVMAIFTNQGQVCAAGSRLYVQETIYEQVKEQLINIVKQMPVGLPSDPNTQMGPLVSKEQLATVMRYVEDARSSGGTILTGGKQPDAPELQNGNFYLPTIIEGIEENCSAYQEEIFGPVLVMVPFSTKEDIVRKANLTEYGLASGVWTQNIETAHYMIEHLEAGSVWVNGYFLNDDNIPLSGFKQSGLGSEMSIDAIDSYTKQKSVVINLA